MIWLLMSCGAKDPELIDRPRDDDQDGYNADVDCDDLNIDIYPDAPELCDERDNDCNGDVDENPVDPFDWYVDADGDAYGDPKLYIETGCMAPSKSAAPNDSDCDDGDAQVNPLAKEICEDGIDNDCIGGDETC